MCTWLFQVSEILPSYKLLNQNEKQGSQSHIYLINLIQEAAKCELYIAHLKLFEIKKLDTSLKQAVVFLLLLGNIVD